MKRVGHGDFKIADFLRTALSHRAGLLHQTFALDPQTGLKHCCDLGRCRLASASRSPRWSVWAWVRKIASSRSMLFSSSGHHGFVITQGSISATCPDDVVRENVLWPKYVIRFPLVLSTLNLQRKPDPRAPTGISCNGAAPFLGCGAHPSGTTRLWSAASLARLRSGPAASFCPNLSYILPAE